jgi:hypothetical protein
MPTQSNPRQGKRRAPAAAQPGSGSEQHRPTTPRPTDRSPNPPGPSATTPHFAIRTNWTPRLRAAGRWLVAAATGETGRRLARAVALTVVLAALVTVLYDHGEAPRAAAAAAADVPAGGPGLEAPRRKAPARPGGLRGRDPAPVGEQPAAVAADWYAARHGVARDRVKALQQDRLSAREVRVLVLADRGRGRLRTALVRVRLGADGWRVR